MLHRVIWTKTPTTQVYITPKTFTFRSPYHPPHTIVIRILYLSAQVFVSTIHTLTLLLTQYWFVGQLTIQAILRQDGIFGT